MYKHLFSPIKIGSLTIRNRVIMAAMGCGTANKDTSVSQRQIAYFTERAKGGAGLIITGVSRVNDNTGATDSNQISLAKDENIPSIRRLADSIHKEGTAIFIQLFHPGNQTSMHAIGGQPTVSPSGLRCQLTKVPSRAMTIEEIHSLAEDFGNAALRAQKAGIDGVEIHCAHGYLLNQFLSPYSNRRTDEYGGSMENRARIVVEIVQAIRKRVGNSFPVTFRISADEFFERSVFPHDIPGLSLKDGVALCKYLVPFGFDAVNVSAGTYETMNTAWEPTSYNEGWKVYLAEAVKKEVDVPVFCAGTIRNPAFAESVIADGRADAVCVARGLLADPNWCNKAYTGRDAEIRRCISCLYCMQQLTTHGHEGKPFGCAINARAAHEVDYPQLKGNGNGRKVVVVGGGPAGMEAARVLSARGFRVILMEKGSRLGGQLLLAAAPPGKGKILWLVEYFETVLPKQGVQILLNTAATANQIKKENPYAVFVTTGAEPIRPGKIEGIHNKNVILYTDILKGNVVLKDTSVIIIGSGMSGLETASSLVEYNNRISIIEMADKIGPGIAFQLLTDAKEHLAGHSVNYYPSHKLLRVLPKQVELEHHGTTVLLDSDYVVLAMGVRGDSSLAEALKKDLERVFPLGDVLHPGKISDAIHAAFDTAYKLE